MWSSSSILPVVSALFFLLHPRHWTTNAIVVGDDWLHGSSVSYNKDGNITLPVPKGTRVGDTLVMFLSRSDGPLPVGLPEDDSGLWTLRANCFKHLNGQQFCYTIEKHCRNMTARVDDDGVQRWYCNRFIRNRIAQDLCTVVFTRQATYQDISADPSTSKAPTIDINMWVDQDQDHHNSMPGWGLLLAVTGTSGRMKGWNGTTCDRTDDSHFGNVPGASNGDLILMSMTYDDTATPDMFLPPDDNTTPLLAWVNGRDEAGFVYGGPVTDDLPTNLTTRGPGGSECKDLTMSLVFAGDRPVEAPSSSPSASPSSFPSRMPSSAPLMADEATPMLPTVIDTPPLNPDVANLERQQREVEGHGLQKPDSPTSSLSSSSSLPYRYGLRTAWALVAASAFCLVFV